MFDESRQVEWPNVLPVLLWLLHDYGQLLRLLDPGAGSGVVVGEGNLEHALKGGLNLIDAVEKAGVLGLVVRVHGPLPEGQDGLVSPKPSGTTTLNSSSVAYRGQSSFPV